MGMIIRSSPFPNTISGRPRNERAETESRLTEALAEFRRRHLQKYDLAALQSRSRTANKLSKLPQDTGTGCAARHGPSVAAQACPESYASVTVHVLGLNDRTVQVGFACSIAGRYA